MAKQINFFGKLLKEYGVYMHTDLSSIVNVNGVGSGIIGVVGLSERGPDNTPVVVNNYVELIQTFGDGPLVRHALAMYIGGASTVVAVRIGSPVASSATASVLKPDNTTATYSIVAREKGTSGNNLTYSVEDVNVDGTSSDENNITRIVVRYSDTRGTDIGETFLFPKYVPKALQSDGTNRFYEGSTKYYYLVNQDSGFIREVPRTWGYGNVGVNAKADFEQKVEVLKDGSEKLVEFPVLDGTDRVPFPLSIIASVVNIGGLGTAPSQFVTIEGVSPKLADIVSGEDVFVVADAETLVYHSALELGAGSNGEDGTGFYTADGIPTYSTLAGADEFRANWNEGLALLEEEDLNFIQPAYLFSDKSNNGKGTTWDNRYGFFKSLMPLFVRHTINQSDDKTRKYRMLISGLPYYLSWDKSGKKATDYLSDIRDVSGIINCDRIQLWAGGFQSRAFSNKVEKYGAEMLASFVTGLNAARQPQQSLTFLPIAGIFTDGLEFTFSTTQREELYTRGLAHVVKRRNTSGAYEYATTHNRTSWTGAGNRGIELVITRRIVDYMNTFLFKNLEENFIGRESRGASTAGLIKSYAEGLLRRLVLEGQLAAFRNVSVVADVDDKTVYYLTYEFQPVTEVDFILGTNKLVNNLA